MVALGSSRPHSSAISANSMSANRTLPLIAKKLSSTAIEGRCSTRCQIAVNISAIVDAGLGLTRHPDVVESERSIAHQRCRTSQLYGPGGFRNQIGDPRAAIL